MLEQRSEAMHLKRRDFIKGCASGCVFLVPGVASATSLQSKFLSPATYTRAQIEKSIKAGFGGGFVLRSHRQSKGLTYAEIEHYGNRYTAASADLVDWQVLVSA
jgi:hypothetical protein